MAGRIKKITVEEVAMTDLEELQHLHLLVHTDPDLDLPNVVGRALPTGTPLRVVRGQFMGRVVVTANHDLDSDGDYYCWMIGDDGRLDYYHFNKANVELYTLNGMGFDFLRPPNGVQLPTAREVLPEVAEEEAPRGRVMDLAHPEVEEGDPVG